MTMVFFCQKICRVVSPKMEKSAQNNGLACVYIYLVESGKKKTQEEKMKNQYNNIGVIILKFILCSSSLWRKLIVCQICYQPKDHSISQERICYSKCSKTHRTFEQSKVLLVSRSTYISCVFLNFG